MYQVQQLTSELIMKYSENKKQEIKNLHNKYLDSLLDIDFENLSNNQMSFIRCVSLSSIMTMKKSKSNEQIMLSPIKDCTTISIQEQLSMMSSEQLAQLGLKKI